jgi:HK97 family phage major capsid protein
VPTAAWRAENANVAEAEPTFRAVVATPRSLSFYFKVSRELLADSPNLETALRTAIAQAFAKELDRAGLRGSGTAPEPRGILNTAGVQSITNGANGAPLTSYSNLISAVQAIRAADAPMPTAVIMAPRSLAKLAGLTDTTNQPLRRPPLLDTWAFIDTSAIPVNLTVGTSNDCSEIFVGDFRSVQFFFREGPVSIQLLKEAFATSGQLAFVCHARVDVGVLYPSALAVVTGVRP